MPASPVMNESTYKDTIEKFTTEENYEAVFETDKNIS